MTMVVVPAGKATLGSPTTVPGYEADEALHDGTQKKPFMIGKTLFTRAHFNALAPKLPDDQTVMTGSLQLPAQLPYRRTKDIIIPAVQAHAPTSWVFRLPSDDEWEYAGRAGTSTVFYTGDAEANLGPIAWYQANSSNMLHDVGLKTPNAWNLFDVLGNSWNWIYLATAPWGGDNDTGTHLVRSCGFDSSAFDNGCRTSNRQISSNPQAFRLVADVPLP
jgi:formylglycine-generating enzyme required for sulfatase activity